MEITQLYEYFKQVGQVSTDTRQIDGPCIFFALRGDRFDGNKYALQALQSGATYAVVDDPVLEDKDGCIFVPDALKTLQDLARHHRRQFEFPVLGITGSNGKTTTKELVSSVLATHYATHFTKGNLNNHIGVPLTLLALPDNTDIAIIEMGANHQGEIAALSEIAEPTHGLITNIGKAHLEGFGGIEGVKKGKSELYRYLAKANGVAFINLNEKFLLDLAEPVSRKLLYKESEQPSPKEPAYELKRVAEKPFLKVGFLDEEGHLLEAESKLTGAYNFGNIATAVAVGKYFKVPAAKIKSAIESYIPSNSRSEILKYKRSTIFMDAYNANPTSMRAALIHFCENMPSPKMAILGDMRELGKSSMTEHMLIAQLAKSKQLEELVTVGPEFEIISDQLGITHFPDVETLKDWFDARQWIDYHILLKASRGIGLERLLDTK